MEVAVRWSPHSSLHQQQFMLVDVALGRLRLYEIQSLDKGHSTDYRQVAQRDKLPNFSAFDWSKTDGNTVGLGSTSGEAIVLKLDSNDILSFPIRHQRKCNSIAFSSRNHLATGLDRVRNDFCMNIYDLNAAPLQRDSEPLRKLSSSEAITSIKYFSNQPETLLAGVSRQCVRLYDLRDSAVGALSYPTKQVHNLAIDPLDENHFISAGPNGDPTISVWDIRMLQRAPTGGVPDGSQLGPIMEMRPAMDNSDREPASIWTLRYCGRKRGSFGCMSSTGQLRIFELGQHAVEETAGRYPDQRGANQSSSQYYTRYTHTLQHPYYDKQHVQESGNRVIAFDFMTVGGSRESQKALGLGPNRDFVVLDIPSNPSLVALTAKDEMIEVDRDKSVCVAPMRKSSSVANDLSVLEETVIDQLQAADGVPSAMNEALLRLVSEFSISQASARQPKRKVSGQPERDGKAQMPSSRGLHEAFLRFGQPGVSLSISEQLLISSVQRRRCQEGYLFDCQKNARIVANDPWLVHLWHVIERLESMAKDDGMIHETIDLSYYGVASFWLDNKPLSQKRIIGTDIDIPVKLPDAVKGIARANQYPEFQGIRTDFPARRQICLEICGWVTDRQKLRQKCLNFIEEGDAYKAIALAKFHGYRDLALELHKIAYQQGLITNIGLGAIIASDHLNDDQRESCAWMSEGAKEPHLKALLAYFISNNWNTVVQMEELPLSDRVAVALRNLNDNNLKAFLKSATADAIKHGDIEGIILTGLTEQAIDLFQSYIRKTSDLQTALLATAFTTPLYNTDPRWTWWKETYFQQLQSWRCFLERTRFTVQHNKRSTTRSGMSLMQEHMPPRQVTLRCNNCHSSLARHDNTVNKFLPAGAASDALGHDAPAISTPNNSKTNALRNASAHSGTVCPKCGRHMPRCGICMMWLGTPDAATPGGAAALASEEDPMGRFVEFCMSCGHGFHAGHAVDWFGKHLMCPVPDCQCMCALKH